MIFFLQGFEGIEYLVIPVDNATLTEFTEQHESSVWEDAIGRRFMELRYMADISNKGRNLKFWERKKSINDTMYSCNWLYLFINWFDMQIKVYFDSKNSFILYYTSRLVMKLFFCFSVANSGLCVWQIRVLGLPGHRKFETKVFWWFAIPLYL